MRVWNLHFECCSESRQRVVGLHAVARAQKRRQDFHAEASPRNSLRKEAQSVSLSAFGAKRMRRLMEIEKMQREGEKNHQV